MNNREKVIRAIEKAKKQSEEYAQDRIIVPFREADMILELLKEQETVVRCKDCWKREFDNCPFYEYSMVVQEDDFFCADGERQQQND